MTIHSPKLRVEEVTSRIGRSPKDVTGEIYADDFDSDEEECEHEKDEFPALPENILRKYGEGRRTSKVVQGIAKFDK